MPPPTISVKVDWDNNGNFTGVNDDITADVGGTSPDATALTAFRGGSADFGSGASSGGGSIVVRNDTGKYSPDNGSSPLTGLLKVGRPVWATATYSAVTYGLLAGYISRIVPDPVSKLATIVVADPMARFGSAEAEVADSTTRSLKDYRGAILTAIGEVVTRRDLADEPEIPGYSGERSGSALDLLNEVGRSTLARHFIRPGTAMPNWYFYTTRDRHYRLDVAATVTLPDTIAGMSGLDVSDDTLINDQFAVPSGRFAASESESVWTAPELPLSLPAFASRTFWADFPDPVISASVVSTSTGAPTVTLTNLGNSAKVVVTAGASASVTTALVVWGRPARQLASIRVRAEDAASITTYGSRYLGSDITASLLTSTGLAQGLADHMVYRFRDPRPRPVVTLVNDFPNQLLAEPFEPVSLTFARLSLSARRYEITGQTLRVSADRNTWTSDLQLQEAPEQTTSPGFFHLDTDTLNSTARLGY